MTNRRARRQEKTRQAILEAARAIIAESGPEDLSMRALAERIDYSPAGLYEYFDSKEAIIRAVCHEGHLRLTSAIKAVDPDLPPDQYLLEIGLAYIRFAVQHPDYYLLMFTTTTEDSPEAMHGEHSSYPILLRAIERGVEAGVFQTREGFGVREMALAAWAQVHGLSMLRITYLRNYGIPFDRVDREVLAALGRGLQPG